MATSTVFRPTLSNEQRMANARARQAQRLKLKIANDIRLRKARSVGDDKARLAAAHERMTVRVERAKKRAERNKKPGGAWEAGARWHYRQGKNPIYRAALDRTAKTALLSRPRPERMTKRAAEKSARENLTSRTVARVASGLDKDWMPTKERRPEIAYPLKARTAQGRLYTLDKTRTAGGLLSATPEVGVRRRVANREGWRNALAADTPETRLALDRGKVRKMMWTPWGRKQLEAYGKRKFQSNEWRDARTGRFISPPQTERGPVYLGRAWDEVKDLLDGCLVPEEDDSPSSSETEWSR